MKIFLMVLNSDFLLFILGIFVLDMARYLQEKIAKCNPKLFGFAVAILLYIFVSYFGTK